MQENKKQKNKYRFRYTNFANEIQQTDNTTTVTTKQKTKNQI